MSGMRVVMYSGALMALFAAIFSALRGGRYVHNNGVAHKGQQ